MSVPSGDASASCRVWFSRAFLEGWTTGRAWVMLTSLRIAVSPALGDERFGGFTRTHCALLCLLVAVLFQASISMDTKTKRKHA